MPNTDDTGIVAGAQTPASITIRAPPFCTDKPALWFAQLEAQFHNKGVVTEQDKFNHTISLIDTRVAAEVEDIIIHPPAVTPYQRLKNGLVERHTKSKQALLLQLLDREKQGDRTPSQHLRHLKSLVPDIDEEVLKARWLSHLPDPIQMGLAIQAPDASFEKLGAAADSLHEILRPANTASVSNLEKQMAELTRQVAALATRCSRSDGGSSRARSRTRGRSRSRSRSQKTVKGVCWYHKKYGKDAKNCQPGCTFSKSENSGESR